MCAIIRLRLEREASSSMIAKRRSKIDLFKAVFGVLFVIMGFLIGATTSLVNSDMVFADPESSEVVNSDNNEENGADGEEGEAQQQDSENTQDNGGSNTTLKSATGDSCQASLGEIGWLVCPVTDKVAEAADWLYEKLEGILAIDPISIEDGSPIYEIWKYCLTLTNIVFVIFLLVVVYSQLTGFGISNYGIKKALPKLIVVAVLVNLSFLICAIAVDLSNIAGNGLRGVFSAIEQSVATGTNMADTSGALTTEAKLSYAKMYSSAAGGAGLVAVGGVVAVETGAIWMLIPVVLGAIVAVASGLITIALRQAVVVLLIMIAPLAIVAYMLPNTEQWFKKWKELLIKMLVFYPMFSLLFGASSLAGFAIMSSAKDGFGMLLGLAVQIFPLFFSWKLMQMSGTFLGTINMKMRGIAARPLAASRGFAESQRMHAKQKHLASGRPITPSLRLMQFVSNRRIQREAETGEYEELVKTRALAGRALSNYNRKGNISRKGQKAYERQARTMRYRQIIEMNKDNFNRGLGGFNDEYKGTIAGMKRDFKHSQGVYSSVIKGNTLEDRLKYLDDANVNAADDLRAEIVRGTEIEYQNAKGFFERAINAKFAEGDHKALLANNRKHQMHPGVLSNPDNLARYERWKAIVEGQDDSVQTILADAASSAHAQAQIRRNKFQAAADLTPATQNVADHIRDLVKSANVVKNIDAIIGGLRILNMRGDTDMVAKEVEHNLIGILSDNGNIELGTYASQALSNYLMFDVKDNDPVLRRFGKYINMQTAAMYNDDDPEKRRKRKDVSWWEYVNSQYVEHDDDGNVARDENGEIVVRKTRGLEELMLGTSYSKVERTGYKSQTEGVRSAAYEIGPDGKLLPEFSTKMYFDKMDGLWNSILANVIGDQFAYLSGSEQIMALAKDITGIGKDGKWDWKYIFGDELKNPTLEQQAEYIVRSRERIKKFLGGHVPSQIARSKTDMLQSIRSQYALFDEVMYINDDGEEVVDLERLRKLNEREFVDGDENTPGSYKNFLKEKQDAVKKRFQKSFKENALKGFAKQFAKGYQGEAKDLLIEMLDPETLYGKYVVNSGQQHRRSRRRDVVEDEEDDGMPVGIVDSDVTGGGVYNDTRERIRESFERYRGAGNSNDVAEFWNEISSVLGSSAEMGDIRIAMEQFEEGVPQYTDISQLYYDIMRTFFGND